VSGSIPARLGRYEVSGLLGEGGYGVVLRARDPVLRRDVAVKVPRGSWWSEDEVLAEARALARLTHPDIVRVLDAGREGAHAYVVLELVEGVDLESLLAASPWPVPPRRAIELLEGPAAAIDHAHAVGILHRDLKPANLLVPPLAQRRAWHGETPGAPGEPSRVKVADFGLFVLATRHGAATASAAGGDPRHAAPEAWRGSPDASSDVYSLATVFFRLVAGRPAVPGSSPAEWLLGAGRPERLRLRDARTDLPADLDAALGRALSPRRDERPVSAGALLEKLREALTRRHERGRLVSDARERIVARDRSSARSCGTCGRKLSPRSVACPFCGGDVRD
jgi:serine/threonine-protein kinase